MNNLSIVIVNWNSKDYVRQCLVSLRKSCGDEMPTIIVVDGASYDGCDEMLASDFPEVTFVQSEENVGFGRSNNLGFQKVDTEYVLFLNPDTEVKGQALHILLDYLKNHPDFGIIGAKLLNSDGSLQTSSVQAFPSPLNQALDSNFLRRFSSLGNFFGTKCLDSEQSAKVEGISGACMLMHSKVFAEIGGFDPAYFMYAEDMDLSWKVTQTGRHNVYLPKAKVIHHGGGSSTGEFSQFSNVAMRESLYYFMTKRLGSFAGYRYRMGMALSSIFRIVLLLPGAVVPFHSKRKEFSKSLKRWWSTLKWSLTAKAPEIILEK